MVSFQLFADGYCTSKKSHAVKGAKKEDIPFYATFGLIKHPNEGYILFDTGYSTRFFEATAKFPYSIYQKMTPVFIKEEDSFKNQLIRQGIQPDEIKYIIVSHFHADHIGGLKDFDKATYICSKKGYSAIKGTKGFKAVKQGYLPSLLPTDFEERSLVIDLDNQSFDHPDLGKTIDLFKDESILLCDLDGHATGQMGVLLKTKANTVFLVADGAWLKENYEELKYPSPLVKLFFGSWKIFIINLNKINRFYKKYPKAIIIATHCEETLNKYKGKTL